MNPDKTLKEMREYTKRGANWDPLRFMELFKELDRFLSGEGGYLPKAWSESGKNQGQITVKEWRNPEGWDHID